MAEQTNLTLKSFDPNGSGRFYANVVAEDGTKYVYVPHEFVFKGARIGDTQYFDQSFLNKDYLGVLKPVVIDEDLLYKSIKNVGYENANKGYLISEADLKKYDKAPNSVTSYKAVDKFAGEVKGMGEQDGNLVYSFAGSGGSNYGIIDSSGTPTETTITPGKRRFGWLGEQLGNIAETFASIPFAPELASLIPGVGVPMYASLKALQTAGSGGDVGDVLTAGAKGYVTGTIAKEVGDLISAPSTGPAPIEVAQPVPAAEAAVTGAIPTSTVYPVAPPVMPIETVIPPQSMVSPGLLDSGNLYSAVDLYKTNVDPVRLETMNEEQVWAEAAKSPYFEAAQSNIDPAFLESSTAEAVANAPVLTSAVLPATLAVPAATIGLKDAFDAARLVKNVSGLLSGSQPTQQGQSPGQLPQGAVDYSGLLSLLSSGGPRTPNIYSLIG